MHVDAGRVDAVLDPQRLSRTPALFEARCKLILGNDLLDAAADNGQLLGARWKLRHGLFSDPEAVE
jgi:hypothetical protein